MQIISPHINEYLASLAPARDPILKEMETYARRRKFPIIGSLAGRILHQLALISGAETIFEMGSGFGYSAYWFASALGDNGCVIATDHSAENKSRAIDYFRRAGMDARLEFHVGDALEILSAANGPFDIIFNDVDKESYPRALDMAVARLRPGGIFVTDNVLWSGRILHRRLTPASKAILEFNHRLFNTPGLFSAIIPIRDGLGIAVKK